MKILSCLTRWEKKLNWRLVILRYSYLLYYEYYQANRLSIFKVKFNHFTSRIQSVLEQIVTHKSTLFNIPWKKLLLLLDKALSQHGVPWVVYRVFMGLSMTSISCRSAPTDTRSDYSEALMGWERGWIWQWELSVSSRLLRWRMLMKLLVTCDTL